MGFQTKKEGASKLNLKNHWNEFIALKSASDALYFLFLIMGITFFLTSFTLDNNRTLSMFAGLMLILIATIIALVDHFGKKKNNLENLR